MATLTGKTLGKYQVFERIGRGGMADVYRGRHMRLDREVAIKVLHSHLAEGDDFQARFEREARAVASLQHPHIVQVYDFDLEDDFIYMVMEFIGGGNLKLRLEQAFKNRHYLEFKFIQQILEQIGSGLDYAHAQGMLHRDVKPGNILLRDDGRAVLADFGIARILSNTQFTATGSLIGTPAYMSPEQGRGETLTPVSDLYSLGVIAYEMLTNQVPFEAETPLATIHQQVYNPLPSMRAQRPELDPALVGVVEKALAKEPGERFASAKDFLHELGAALSQSPGMSVSEDEMAVTVVLEPDNDEARKETVVMEEDGPGETVVLEAEESAVEGTPVGTSEEAALPPEKPSRLPEEQKPAAGPDRSWRRYWPAILIGVVVVAVVVIGALSGWFGGGTPGCGDIGQCVGLSENAMQAGDFADAVNLLDQAIDQVTTDEQPAFAELWCRRADALVEQGRIDEAVGSFETCAAWTHSQPEFEDLRQEVQRRISEILGG